MLIKSSMSYGAIILLFAAACGAGGGGGDDVEADSAYLVAAPSESLLCSFIVGQTTEAEIVDALGEPTFATSTASGSDLQYWVGSDSFTGATLPRIISFMFDADGQLRMAYVQQLPFPGCWRNSETDLDDQQ